MKSKLDQADFLLAASGGRREPETWFRPLEEQPLMR